MQAMDNTTAGEDCDDGGETASCDVDCTIVECGDRTLNTSAGEECDDGNTVGADGCSAFCTLSEPLPSCLIDFDSVCPDGITPVCGALFQGAGMCVADFPNCMDSLPQSYELDSVTIELAGDVMTLSVAFWGDNVDGEFTEGSMEFYDASWNWVDSLQSDSCFFGQPPVHSLTFSQPVRYIDVSANMSPVWMDSLWINP